VNRIGRLWCVVAILLTVLLSREGWTQEVTPVSTPASTPPAAGSPQGAPPPPAQDSQKKPEAEKTVQIIGERVKDVQELPVSGMTLDASVMDERRLTSVQDLTRELPNISSTDGGAPGVANIYSARGLVNGAFFAGPSMTVYVDDIPFGDPFTYVQSLGVLDSAQVLLGPQFTTFGRYGYGGVINVQTRRPTDTLEGGVYGEGGNHGLINTGGYMMGALIPGELRFRVGVSEESFGGVIHNSATHRFDDTLYRVGGNFSVFYTPTPNWDIAVVSEVRKFEDGAPRENKITAPDPYVVSSDFPGRTDLMTDQEALRVGYKSGDLQFLSVTARRDFNINPADIDLDFTQTPGNFARIVQDESIVSQEFRVKSESPNSAFDWSGGVYGHYKANTQTGAHGFAPGSDTNFFSEHERWASVFADVDYKAFKRWHFRVGARYDYVAQVMNQTTVIPFVETINFDLKDRFPMGSFKAGVEYEIAQNAKVYVDGGHAYKPGGFSAFADNGAIASFQSEKTWFVQAGEKATFMDDKVKANVSGFFYDIHGYQLERVTSGGNDYFVINTESARSMGGEAEIRAEILPHVELFAQGGITRMLLGVYADPVDPFAGFAGASHEPGAIAPFVPRYTGILGVSAKYSGFFSHLEWVATGTVHYDDLNPSFLQRNYGVLNGGLGYGANHWKVSLFANNLNNRFYWTNMVGGGENIGSPSLPRELGIRLDVMF
jgi:iron complex outermembrane receptor protein